jgi:hypothetical protein
MEQSPSWGANSHSAGQEILLFNPKVHYHVDKSQRIRPRARSIVMFSNILIFQGYVPTGGEGLFDKRFLESILGQVA